MMTTLTITLPHTPRLLGGNESLNMLMAGATGFIALLLQIPSGLLVEKIGLKRGIFKKPCEVLPLLFI